MAADHLLLWLDAFNRKERFYLLNQALGGFGLAPQFRNQLTPLVGVAVPSNAFVWMDYHLDWVHAALELRSDTPSEVPTIFYESPNFRELDPTSSAVYINHDQEDIDLLVAFERNNTRHLIFIEAKGETSWSNSQMSSKVLRLTKIFKGIPDDIRPTLVLASPVPPSQLEVPEGADPWVKDSSGTWRYLKLDPPKGRRKIERKDATSRWWQARAVGKEEPDLLM